MALIAVDFDGTLVGYDEDGHVFATPGAKEAMKALKRAGHHIVIHTARTTLALENGTLREELDWISSVLGEFGIPFDEIYKGPKFIADFYIDDRAVAYEGDWIKTLEKLSARHTS